VLDDCGGWVCVVVEMVDAVENQFGHLRQITLFWAV
jgi:hypothetical protein